MPADLPEVIASRLVIADAEGRPRIELALADGEPAIRLLDADGKVRVRLELVRDDDSGAEEPSTVAELELTAAEESGEVVLTAGSAGYAAIGISGQRTEAQGSAAGAWIETRNQEVAANIHDDRTGTGWTWTEGETRVRHDIALGNELVPDGAVPRIEVDELVSDHSVAPPCRTRTGVSAVRLFRSARCGERSR